MPSSTQQPAEQHAAPSRSLELLASAARLLVLGLLVGCPWYYGSVTWTAQAVCNATVFVIFLLALIYAARQRLRIADPLSLSLVGLLLLAMLQTVPLPGLLWSGLSSGAAFEQDVDALAAEWLAQSSPAEEPDAEAAPLIEEIRGPRTLSIHPLQTRASAVTLAAAIAMLVSCGILFRHTWWRLAMLAVLAATTLANAMLGVLQSVAWDDWTLLEMNSLHFFSTFVSRNSAPQFFAVGVAAVIGLMVWWVRSRGVAEADKRYGVRYPAVNPLARARRRMDEVLTDLDLFSAIGLLTISLLLLAVLTTASRGGILAFTCAAAVTVCVGATRNGNILKIGVGLSICLVLALVLLNLLGIESAPLERMNSISQEAHQLNNSRLALWKTVLANVNWLCGSGLGTFHFAVLPMMDNGNGTWFYHAESIPVELLSEFGLLGLVAASCGLAWLFHCARQDARKTKGQPILFLPLVFAVTAVGLQSLVDFSLIIPGVFLPLAALIGGYLGERQSPTGNRDDNRQRKKRGSSRRNPRRGSQGASTSSSPRSFDWRATALVVGVVWIGGLQGVWSLQGFARSELESELLPGRANSSNTGHPERDLVVGRRLQLEFQSQIEQVLRSDNSLTEAQITDFSRPETLAAALTAGPDGILSPLEQFARTQTAAVELLRSSADRMHSSLTACPLDWRAAWGLMRSDCPALSSTERARNYARLWLLTRIDPRRQQDIGRNAALGGQPAIALAYWKYSIAQNPHLAASCSSLLAVGIAQADVLSVLPASPLLRASVARQLAQQPMPPTEFIQFVLEQIEPNQLLAAADSAQDWRLVTWVAQQSGDTAWQIQALRNVVDLAPGDGDARRDLAALIMRDNPQEAIELLQKALRSSISKPDYETLLQQAQEQLAEQQASSE